MHHRSIVDIAYRKFLGIIRLCFLLVCLSSVVIHGQQQEKTDVAGLVSEIQAAATERDLSASRELAKRIKKLYLEEKKEIPPDVQEALSAYLETVSTEITSAATLASWESQPRDVGDLLNVALELGDARTSTVIESAYRIGESDELPLDTRLTALDVLKRGGQDALLERLANGLDNRQQSSNRMRAVRNQTVSSVARAKKALSNLSAQLMRSPDNVKSEAPKPEPESPITTETKISAMIAMQVLAGGVGIDPDFISPTRYEERSKLRKYDNVFMSTFLSTDAPEKTRREALKALTNAGVLVQKENLMRFYRNARFPVSQLAVTDHMKKNKIRISREERTNMHHQALNIDVREAVRLLP